MDGLILGCLPEELRVRYADEILELLDGSHRPLRDRADLLITAIGLRLGRRISWWLSASAVFLGLSLAAVVHSISNLSGGAVETLDHWWSTFAAGGFVVWLGALTVLSLARRRAKSWGGPQRR